MSTTNDGGPAFPFAERGEKTTIRPEDFWNSKDTGNVVVCGMSLRDYFAAKALQGMLADPNSVGLKPDTLSALSYKFADAMLAARQQGAGNEA